MSSPGSPSPQEDRLLEAARAGNADAFWQLGETFRPYLRTVAVRVLGGRAATDGSDLVNQSLIVALERLAQFRGHGAVVFLGWLTAIVRNDALKSLRQAGRTLAFAAAGCDPEQLAADSSGPDQRAGRREEAARLLAAIQRLSNDDRLVIDLRNFQELSFEEVAQRMGRSAVAVRQLWGRALKRLRDELGDEP